MRSSEISVAYCLCDVNKCKGKPIHEISLGGINNIFLVCLLFSFRAACMVISGSVGDPQSP